MEKWLTQWLGKRWTDLSIEQRHQFRDGRWSSMKCNFDGTTDQAEVVPLGKASVASRVFPTRRKTGDLKVDKTNVHFGRLVYDLNP
jgi:hypothetical protein